VGVLYVLAFVFARRLRVFADRDLVAPAALRIATEAAASD